VFIEGKQKEKLIHKTRTAKALQELGLSNHDIAKKRRVSVKTIYGYLKEPK
jgi:transposase